LHASKLSRAPVGRPSGMKMLGCRPSKLSTALRKFIPPIHSSAPRRLNVVVLT
jgi:hypothetical protein